MSVYTKGPWMAKGGEVLTADYEYEGQTICDHICNCEVINGVSPNAQLIAAAPELLQALQSMLSKAYKQNWNDNYPEEVEAAQAAISKALGQ